MATRDIIRVEFIPPARWWQRAKWKLIQPYVSGNGDVIAKEGFVSDGASIPRSLWWLFSPTGKYFGAAIVHDYIIVVEGDWDKANKQFEEELRYLEVEGWQCFLLVNAVKFYAWVKKTFGISIGGD